MDAHFETTASENPALSVCGTDCSACYCYGKLCPGCNACRGKVFHAPEGTTCAIYDCTVNQKGFQNCGACDEAPCSIWRQTRDPKYSDEEFEETIRARMAALKNSEK